MLTEIEKLDKQVFLFLNNLGKQPFDFFWVFITKQINWFPLFLFLLYIIYKKMTLKSTLTVLLFVAFLIIFGDQFTNLIKETVMRLRPCNDPEILNNTRILHKTPTYSFFSGHATNSMAVSVFLYLIFKNKIKYFYLLFIWPAIFAYSRIYIGVHFPLDILTGYFVGTILGFSFYFIYLNRNKIFNKIGISFLKKKL